MSRPAAPLVSSNSPAAGTNALQDIKGLVPIPSAWSWVWWVAGGLALLALGFFLWRRRRKRVAAHPAAPPSAPHTVAYNRLREALLLIHEPRPFCILVSDTVREYLEQRFQFHAPERTTEEFLEEMQASPLLTLDQKEALGRFLTRCDLVKFAQFEPAVTELRSLHDAALRLVDETSRSEPAPRALLAAAAGAPAGSPTGR